MCLTVICLPISAAGPLLAPASSRAACCPCWPPLVPMGTLCWSPPLWRRQQPAWWHPATTWWCCSRSTMTSVSRWGCRRAGLQLQTGMNTSGAGLELIILALFLRVCCVIRGRLLLTLRKEGNHEGGASAPICVSAVVLCRSCPWMPVAATWRDLCCRHPHARVSLWALHT